MFSATLLGCLLPLSAALAGPRTVRVAVDGPGADPAPTTASVPWSAEWTAAGKKVSVRFSLRAEERDGAVVVIGDVVEQKGSKEKPARHFELLLDEAGVPLSERTEWLAPKGYTAPDGTEPVMLQWRLSASWDETLPTPAWDPTPPGDWPTDAFVVVRTGASLYKEPAAQAPQSTAGFSSEAAGEVWQVVGEQDGRLALVAPAPASAAHPMPLPAVAGTGVRLFVDKGDILPVVPKALDAIAEDGTGLRLRAGVPVEVDGETRQAGVGPLRVSVAEVELAERYTPSSPPPVREGERRSIRARQGKAFGETHDGPVEVKVIGTPDRAAPGRSAEVLVPAVQVGGRFAVQGPAGEALVRVRPGLERVDMAASSDAKPAPEGPTVPAGTPLSWINGLDAGTTTHAVLRSESTRSLDDGRTCGRLGGDGGLTLCWQ
jgi:hypothetical protein